MKSVFILQHEYENGECDEVKFIGTYSTRMEAEQAIKRLSVQPGFRERIEGFHISEYELDKDHWTEGFASMISMEVKDIAGQWKTVHAECLPNERYQITEKYENNQLAIFKDGDIVKCEMRDGVRYAIEKVDENAE